MIEIRTVSVAIVKGMFTYALEVSMIETEEGSLFRIIPIPGKVNKIHLSITSDHDLIIKYRDSYVPTDRYTIDKCKKID